MSVAGEVTDTSIMEVGRSRPQFQYSRVNIVLKSYSNITDIYQQLFVIVVYRFTHFFSYVFRRS